MLDIVATNSWAEKLQAIARRAGEIIMEHRAHDLGVVLKSDNSQVTKADIAADEYICENLRKLSSAIPVISEEGVQHLPDANSAFWCVDPLDGTKGFIKGGNDFTVNIALVVGGLPLLGVIYIPPTDELYYGEVGVGCYKIIGNKRSNLGVRKPSDEGNVVIVSRFHNDARQQEMRLRFNASEFIVASSSLKFCRIAEGIADIYPRFGTTMEWDTAAGHAILKAAGGRVCFADDETSELCYGKAGFTNPHFIASGISFES